MSNPPDMGGVRAFNELYSSPDGGGDDDDVALWAPAPPSLSAPAGSAAPFKRKWDAGEGVVAQSGAVPAAGTADAAAAKVPRTAADDEGFAHLRSERFAAPEEASASASSYDDRDRTLYVGSLPPSVTERPLKEYFSDFGEVSNVRVVRDRTTGISRGFAFVTFYSETSAAAALNLEGGRHVIEGRPAKVSPAARKGQEQQRTRKNAGGPQNHLADIVLPNQTRIYVGPLDDSIVGTDLVQQFGQFGTITGVSRIKGSSSPCPSTSTRPGGGGGGSSYGLIDFREVIAIGRAFASKVFVQGRHVKVVLSRFAMELVVSDTVVFFFEAHEFCDETHLEQHFRLFGQVFRCAHLKNADGSNKTYGFVDFLTPMAASQAVEEKSQLLYPGQYVRVSKLLPQAHLYDLFSMGDARGNELLKRLERSTPTEGTWGGKNRLNAPTRSFESTGPTTESKVRIPSAMIGKLIGERGKTIAEISRDSKTKITIPKADEQGSSSVVITVCGAKEDIKVAQYLMQKVLKGSR